MTMQKNHLQTLFCFALSCLFSMSCCFAAEQPTEDDFYRITTFETPEDVVLEVGALQWLPEGKLAVSSRRGEIWTVDHPLAKEVGPKNFTRFAQGLHEVLGLAYRDGWLYAVQRPELTRIRDNDADGSADEFEVVSDEWGINGDYHEYAFGSKFDKEGNIWLTFCLTGSFTSDSLYRGWCMRITPEGKMIPTCSGVRSPGGMGSNVAGDMFYTDNQGPWNGTCSLKHLKPGKFMGHPTGLKWSKLAEPFMGPEPQSPESGSRLMVEAKKIPQLEPPAIMFPYTKMGKSAAGVQCDTSDGKFGPFTGQMFVTDQSASTVMRCYLEKVAGHYQGACFPFREGFGSGSLAIEFAPNGSLFVGGTNRGWSSVGTKPFALERLDWTGEVPFEILEMRAKPYGFELAFTDLVDPKIGSSVDSYSMKTYTYIYQSSYGSPEVDATTPKITKAIVSPDGRSVQLYVDGLQEGHVHELHANGVRSRDGLTLLHSAAYYTLNYLPVNE